MSVVTPSRVSVPVFPAHYKTATNELLRELSDAMWIK